MVEVVKQIAARHELHHEAAVGVILVVVQEGDDKGMVFFLVTYVKICN
jgi:hypothetical protein